MKQYFLAEKLDQTNVGIQKRETFIKRKKVLRTRTDNV